MDSGFLTDNVFQLHKGETCFVYKEEFTKAIVKKFEEKYHEKLDVEKQSDYWVIRPIKKVIKKEAKK